MLRKAYAVFKAYVLTDLVRSKGFVFSLISISMWMMLFIPSITLFMASSVDPSIIAGHSFTAMLIFLFYSVATWDWAAEIRWMINDGRLEYYMASGSGFLPHYLGIMPVSLMWIALASGVNYIVLSIIWRPPMLAIHDIMAFLCGLVLIIVNLISYALILGGTMLASGVSGFVVEIIGFILPIASGGLTPLVSLPQPLKVFALLTPFSYPAELLRYSLLKMPIILELSELIFRGTIYSVIFLAIAMTYFKHQLKKIRKEGVRATALW